MQSQTTNTHARLSCPDARLHQVEVGGGVTSLDLAGLISQTEYNVAVTPIYAEGSGAAMPGTAVTGEWRPSEGPGGDLLQSTLSVRSEVVPAPKNLQFSEVSQSAFRVSWEHGAPDVALYRLSWVKRGENDYQDVSGPLCESSFC